MHWKKTAAIAVGIVAIAGIIVIGVHAIESRPHPIAASNTAAGKTLWHCGMHPQVVQDHPGECPICHMALTPMNSSVAANPAKGGKPLWWDPMLGPSSITDHPGKSAMGMEMVPYTPETGKGSEIIIDPTVVQNMGVRTAAVSRGTLHKHVRTIGLLRLPEPGIHEVSLKINGWIEKLYADQDGMHVDAGQPLFEIYSPDLQVAAQELIAAAKAEKALPADASDAVRREAQTLAESSRRKLILWGIAEQDIAAIASADQPPRTLPFRSPASGYIDEKTVVQGSAVQAMTKLLRIVEQSSLWLDAQVYSGQMPFVKPGQEVTATVDGLPGKTWRGEISFVYPRIDPATRTLSIRVTLQNPQGELRPGMYATAEIATAPVADAILAPQEAIIDTGARKIAFVAQGDGHFALRSVQTGLTGDLDRVQIVAGLMPGEMVVTSGQFLMDVESRTIEAARKLSSGGEVQLTMAEAEPAPAAPAFPAATAPSSPPPQTQPATMPFELRVVYCPMVKARWLQPRDEIANPYMGSKMIDCGTIEKKIGGGPEVLAPLLQAYLAVAAGLDADKVDPAAVKSLKSAAGQLKGDESKALQQAIDVLAAAANLKDARTAFHNVSEQLITRLDAPAK